MTPIAPVSISNAIGRCRIKICGITNQADAELATEAGADLLGFIFYPKSPRRATLEAARESVLAARLVNPLIICIGVFVNEAPDALENIRAHAGLDAVQLHGDEKVEVVRSFGGAAYKAIKRIDVSTDEYIQTRRGHMGADQLPDLMLDADHPTLFGGSGARADESLARRLANRCNLLLAGGLNADNVADVVRLVRPWGVDVASGTERLPGLKDPGAVRAFIAAVRQV